MIKPKRADRCGWRRRTGSFRWEKVVTLPNCTQGEIWDALQKECFLKVSLADEDFSSEWEYAISLAGETPKASLPRSGESNAPFHRGYETKVMRPR